MYGGPGPEYDDPANCAPEEDQYGSQYGAPYGYDHYGSRGSVGRRSVGMFENSLVEVKVTHLIIIRIFRLST